MTSADLRSTWGEFLQAAEEASSLLEADLDLDDVDRAAGLRFLSRLTQAALIQVDPSDDPSHPRFTEIGPPVTYGIPNPDNFYQRCSVDPSLEYRITGRRNSVHFLGFAAGGPGAQARPGVRSHLDHSELEVAADGTFEISVGGAPKAGNWIELADDARQVMVRQTFLRRDEEQAAELRIEVVGEPRARRAPNPEVVARRLKGAAAQLRGLAAFWPGWVAGFGEHAETNRFFSFDEATHLAIGGDPKVRTPLCRWSISEGQALVVTLRPPRCEYWNIQLANIWTEPVEPLVGTSCRNASQVEVAADGSVTVVISNVDPGLPNWLDAGGLHQGTISVRWVNADSLPIPEATIVDLPDDRMGRP